MRRAFLAGLLALALSACANTAGQRTFTGVWEWGFETSAFTTADGAGPYWLVATGSNHETLTEPLRSAGSVYGRVAIVVEGTLSEDGHYGQLGAYRRQLTVTRVIEARLMSALPPGQSSGS